MGEVISNDPGTIDQPARITLGVQKWFPEGEKFDTVMDAEADVECEAHADYLSGQNLCFVYRIADQEGKTAAMNYVIMRDE